ncbi:MAG: PocR ligand-binding domain-containing protein [Clostridia bacterium]|nr:PocR ligand-binding domain-containing protein [Clostridia bacterium]
MKNERLRTICDDIYTITGIKPVLYDAEMRLLYAHPLAMGEFCREVRKNPERSKRCLACDRAAFETCRRTGELCIYQCHMGLTEAAAPIQDHGTVIGYLLFGQLLSEADRPGIERQIRNEPRLQELLSGMDSTGEQIIRASARLMSMCTSYIHLQNILKRQQENLALSLADYIQNNLKEDLSVPTLCRQFGLSRSTLYTVSKNAFGMGISEYVRTRRLDTAVELLEQNTMAIYRVAEAVGIPDANYFSKLIRGHTGRSPKMLKKNKSYRLFTIQ